MSNLKTNSYFDDHVVEFTVDLISTGSIAFSVVLESIMFSDKLSNEERISDVKCLLFYYKKSMLNKVDVNIGVKNV